MWLRIFFFLGYIIFCWFSLLIIILSHPFSVGFISLTQFWRCLVLSSIYRSSQCRVDSCSKWERQKNATGKPGWVRKTEQFSGKLSTEARGIPPACPPPSPKGTQNSVLANGVMTRYYPGPRAFLIVAIEQQSGNCVIICCSNPAYFQRIWSRLQHASYVQLNH